MRIHGPATPEDVAALTALLSALGGEERTPTPPPRVWGDAARQVGADVRPTRGGWSRSALPR